MKHNLPFIILCVILTTSFAGSVFSQDIRDNNKDLLNENDVKSFVYQWFSWLDHQVSEFYFMSHLSSSGFEMLFPEVEIHDYEGFKKWYDGMKENTQWNSYSVSDIKVSGDCEKGFDVELTVRRRAETYKGEHIDNTYRQNWKLQPSYDGNKFIIRRYVVNRLKAD